MRRHGTLRKWNDDRGFGFIIRPGSHEELFVHISAFPKDGIRPRAGETLSFDVEISPDGRQRAVAVERPGGRKAAARNTALRRHPGNRVSFTRLVAGAAVVAIGLAVYKNYNAQRREQPAYPAASTELATAPADSTFRCDGRTHCSQMTSCAEAEYFLKNCPGVQMDGNHDGEPCEQQWCN
jgi:cold shock CspA family protein